MTKGQFPDPFTPETAAKVAEALGGEVPPEPAPAEVMTLPVKRDDKGRRLYTDADREKAIEHGKKVGLAVGSADLGIPKPTLRSWLIAAGVDMAALSGEASANAMNAAIASRSARMARIESAKDRLTVSLVSVAEIAVSRELEILSGRGKGPDGRTLHEIVGARTRAIHDLQLLLGEATSRSESSTPDERRAKIAERIEALRQRRREKADEALDSIEAADGGAS